MSQKSIDGFFKWPETNANIGDGSIDVTEWHKLGVLKVLRYQVGHDGEPKGVRERILSEVFRTHIPPVFPAGYMSEWSGPQSVPRLQKTAESIAAFVRNAKRRRDSKMLEAISDWESDLRYLYVEYYVGRYHFDWPSTLV